MKKFFVIALAAMSMTLVSCKKSVEDQAKAYATQCIEAMKANDNAKLEKLDKEAEEWVKGLSEADQKKATEIMQAEVEKAMPELMGAAMNAVAEEAADEVAEEVSDAADEAVEAVEELGEAIEEAVTE